MIVHLFAYTKGENAIVIIPGANSRLSPDDVTNASGIISNAKVLICQMEVPNDTTLEALKLAKKHNGTEIIVIIMKPVYKVATYVGPFECA